MLIFGDTFGSTMVVRGALHIVDEKFVRATINNKCYCIINIYLHSMLYYTILHSITIERSLEGQRLSINQPISSKVTT